LLKVARMETEAVLAYPDSLRDGLFEREAADRFASYGPS
jgi:hypothetical protein